MHQVSGDKIIESTTGKEVMWRGAGGSYTLNASTLAESLSAWESMYIPTALAGNLDTMRLSFKFPWDTLTNAPTLDLDYAKMDAIIALLASYGIKSILDMHGTYTAIPAMNPLKDTNGNILGYLTQGWQEVATHYKDNQNVIAYEIANEPALGSTGYTRRDNAQGYHDVTLALRAIDPLKICIWESPAYYVPTFEDMQDLLLPNIVYTIHRWWTYGPPNPITEFGAHELSIRSLDYMVYARNVFDIPFWLGEFGGPNGGNPSTPYDPNDIWWQICRELLWRVEEQVMGWNLWMGLTRPTQNRLAPYIPSLVPNNYTRNSSLVRQLWTEPQAKPLYRYTVAENVDSLGDFAAEMYHNNDFITLSAGPTVRVTRGVLPSDMVVAQ